MKYHFSKDEMFKNFTSIKIKCCLTSINIGNVSLLEAYKNISYYKHIKCCLAAIIL